MDTKPKSQINPDLQGTLDTSFGRAVSVVRCSQNMTTAQLSTKSGINLNRLIKVENGFAPMTLSELFTLSQLLGTPSATLIVVADACKAKWRQDGVQ